MEHVGYGIYKHSNGVYTSPKTNSAYGSYDAIRHDVLNHDDEGDWKINSGKTCFHHGCHNKATRVDSCDRHVCEGHRKNHMR